MIDRVIDKAFDAAVLPGFTSLGFLARSRSWDESAPDLAGGHYLVTGASSGLGTAVCEQLCALGADVHMLVRDVGKGSDVKARLAEKSDSDRLHLWQCDLSRSASIRTFAERFREEVPELRALVNNAGAMPQRREHTPDGLELTFATNVAGPFLLTTLLLEPLCAGAPGRVVNVSSGGMYAKRLQPDDLQLERSEYDAPGFYAHSKRCEVVLTEIWQKRFAGSGVSFHCMHPGWADTPGVEDSLPRFHRLMGPLLRSPDQGADTISWLCWSVRPTLEPGLFWHDREPRPTHRLPGTRETEADRESLWRQVTRLVEAEAPVTAAGSAR